MNYRQIIVGLILLSPYLNHANGLDTLRAEQYFQKADTFLLFNRHDSSVFFFQKAFDLYKKAESWEGMVSAKNKISENLCAIFELKEALETAEEALALATEKLGENHLERANALSNVGNVYYLTGQHERALEEYNEAEFWEALMVQMGKRDFFRSMTEKEKHVLEEEAWLPERIQEMYQKYDDEFSKHGLERLEIQDS